MTHDDRDGPTTASAEGRHDDLIPRVPGQEPVNRASTRTLLAVLAALAVFLYLIRSILLPFVVAGAAAYVCTPAVDRLAHRLRLPRWVAAVAMCLILLAFAGGLAAFGLPSLVDETRSTLANLPQTIERAAATVIGHGQIRVLGQETDAKTIAAQAMQGLRSVLAQSDVIAAVAGGGVAIVFTLIFTVVLLFYFMIGGPLIARNILWLVPPKQRPLVEAIWNELDPVLFRYFASIAIVVTYATIAAYAGLAFVLHLKEAGVLAVLTGLLEMLPIVGPAASAIIAGLFALRGAAGPAGIIAYMIYAVVLRLSIDQLVSPLVLGRAGRVHPTVIIFCFLAGGVLFGIAGVILAIPVALTIKTALAVLYEERLEGEEE